MTICLAAIAKEKNSEYIVFATDHMVTTAIGQFEHSITKYKQLDGSTVAMLAGNPLIFEELTNLKKQSSKYQDIKQEIYTNFKNKRWEIIENEIFNIYGIDKPIFKEWLQKQIPNEHVNQILKEVSQFSLQTSILLVGFENNEAQITEINENNMVDFRVMNFHAIGSGNIQAANTLLFQKHDKCENLLPTVYNVYKAKKNAEVLQGVGKETEVLVLSKESCKKIDEKSITVLRNIYYEEHTYGTGHDKLKQVEIW